MHCTCNFVLVQIREKKIDGKGTLRVILRMGSTTLLASTEPHVTLGSNGVNAK